MAVHFWWKENLIKYQKFSKYYDHGCLENFLLRFMPWLTVPIVEKCHILPGIYFIILKERSRRSSKVFQYQIWTLKKRSKKILSCKTNFSTFLQLSCSNYRLKLIKDLRVAKIIKQINFEVAWGKLEAKKQKTVSKDNHGENIWEKL